MDALATSDEYHALTGGAVRDPLVLEAASGVARAYCGWQVSASAAHQVTLDGHGGPLLALPCPHVTDVSAVSVDDETLDESTYGWSAAGLLRRIGGQWPVGYRRIAVTYTGGYTTVPPEIVAVVCSIASRQSVTTPGVSSRRIGERQLSYSGDAGSAVLSVSERLVLDRYRLPEGP